MPTDKRLHKGESDRLGNPVKPKEWFLVPVAAIDEMVERIKDGSITRMVKPIIMEIFELLRSSGGMCNSSTTP